MSILIQENTSSSCRGWEGNSSEIFESQCDSVLEYCIQMEMEEQNISREQVLEYMNENRQNNYFGWIVEDNNIVHFEGEEVTTTYKLFVPDQEFINLLTKYVK